MKKPTLADKDKKYLWHPFTQMQGWCETEPLIITKGCGVYLYDNKGRKYIDGVSSLWVTVHGHRHKALDKALKKQIGRIAHSTLLGLANDVSIELAEKIIEIAPKGITRVFYSDSGSTAMEIAVKMAYQYWEQNKQSAVSGQRSAKNKKDKFISMNNAYHGDTLGSVSIGGIDLFHKKFKPLLFKVDHVSTIEQLEKMLKKQSKVTAAVIIEPLVQGAAGMLMWPKGFLKTVRKLCDKYNVLMICDEVATGFGRTGTMFACEQEGVTPDIMAIAKGLTGGYLPLAATLTKEKIYNNFLGTYDSKRTFFHGHTYTGNPLGCAVALANLATFKKEKTIEKLQPKIESLTKELKKFWTLEHVGDIRQKGFMVGIELFEDVKTKRSYPGTLRIGHKVIMEARKHGVIVRPLDDTIILMPPLGITIQQLRVLMNAVFVAIKNVTE